MNLLNFEKELESAVTNELRPLAAIVLGFVEIAIAQFIVPGELKLALSFTGVIAATFGFVSLAADWMYTLAWVFAATIDAGIKWGRERRGRSEHIDQTKNIA